MSARRTPWLHRLLLRAYPAAWREHYGDEFTALLSARAWRAADLGDILRGALDARLHPGRTPRRALEVLQTPVPAMPVRSAASFGIVAGAAPIGALSRRSFMRRMLGAGVALLALEFLGGTLSFLWPNIRQGVGAAFRVGTLADILAAQPSFANGEMYAFNPARAFLVNVPAATALASGAAISVPNPGADQLLALWRKCPHLGCLVPAPCDELTRIRCRCHGSTYNVLGEKLKEGPAERGLDRFAVRIEDDGVVVIDSSQITQGAPNLGPDRLVFSDPHPWDATCDV